MLNTEKREGRRLRSPFWIWYPETVQQKETNPIASHTTLLSVGNVSSVKGQKKGKKRLKASQDSFYLSARPRLPSLSSNDNKPLYSLKGREREREKIAVMMAQSPLFSSGVLFSL